MYIDYYYYCNIIKVALIIRHNISKTFYMRGNFPHDWPRMGQNIYMIIVHGPTERAKNWKLSHTCPSANLTNPRMTILEAIGKMNILTCPSTNWSTFPNINREPVHNERKKDNPWYKLILTRTVSFRFPSLSVFKWIFWTRCWIFARTFRVAMRKRFQFLIFNTSCSSREIRSKQGLEYDLFCGENPFLPGFSRWTIDIKRGKSIYFHAGIGSVFAKFHYLIRKIQLKTHAVVQGSAVSSLQMTATYWINIT